jgi:probable HAF family extracellular repeat protein
MQNNSRCFRFQFAVISIAIFLSAVNTAQAVSYTFTDLGTLGEINSEASAINNTGQVVGYSYNTYVGYDPRATLWNGTTLTALGSLGVGASQALGINDAGQVAGAVNFSTTSNDWHATVWNGTTITDLGSGHAFAINNTGQVVGINYANSHATLWNGTTSIDLGDSSGIGSSAYAINNAGQVAGFSGYQATLWNGTTATYLDGLGGLGSRAHGINDAGQVAGYSWTMGNADTHATLWNGTAITDLGSGIAKAINNTGQVVGQASTTNGQHATLWNGTTATDLNIFLDAATISAGWVLATADDINENGSIVGIAINNLTEQRHGYLLAAPVPVPAAAYLFGSGLIGLFGLARNKASKKA